jgi:hypothetical protein
VWDEAAQRYTEKAFSDAAGDLAPFMTNFGRTVITELSIRVEKNYNMRCQTTFDTPSSVLFARPLETRNDDGTTAVQNPEGSYAWHLDRCGRVECISFPFAKVPWLKCWSECPVKPEASKHVTAPLNYPFSAASTVVSDVCKIVTGAPLTDEAHRRHFAENMVPASKPATRRTLSGMARHALQDVTKVAAEYTAAVAAPLVRGILGYVGSPRLCAPLSLIGRANVMRGYNQLAVSDIWGTSRCTLLYVSAELPRITANGYAVSTRRRDLQHVLHAFDQLYESLLYMYAQLGKYPIGFPTEIRVCGKNDHSIVSGGKGVNPPLDPLSPTADDVANGFDIVVYFNVLSMPGAPDAAEFYAELEDRLARRPTEAAATDYSYWFTGDRAKLGVEWSKAWAYDAARGPWCDAAFVARQKALFPRFGEMAGALAAHDAMGIFTNSWLSRFLPPVADAELAAPLTTPPTPLALRGFQLPAAAGADTRATTPTTVPPTPIASAHSSHPHRKVALTD